MSPPPPPGVRFEIHKHLTVTADVLVRCPPPGNALMGRFGFAVFDPAQQGYAFDARHVEVWRRTLEREGHEVRDLRDASRAPVIPAWQPRPTLEMEVQAAIGNRGRARVNAAVASYAEVLDRYAQTGDLDAARAQLVVIQCWCDHEHQVELVGHDRLGRPRPTLIRCPRPCHCPEYGP